MPLALGVDFEHITHTPAYRSLSGEPDIEIDIQRITQRLLTLFDHHDAQVTFFVVAEMAREFPELLRKIADCGHEIASHTMTHQSLPDLDMQTIQEEVDDSKTLLEQITKESVTGFRAPTFQIDDRVYDALLETGYEYSSSVMSCVPIPGFYSNQYDFDAPTSVNKGSTALTEFPVAISPYVPLPVSGAWTRLLGRTYTIKSIERRLSTGRLVATYVHPWEFAELHATPLPFRNRRRTGEWMFDTYDSLLRTDAQIVRLGEQSKQTDPKYRHIIAR